VSSPRRVVSQDSRQRPAKTVPASWLEQACAHCDREYARARYIKGGGSLPLRASCIRTNDDTVFNVEVLPDPPQRAWLRVKVVDWDIEKSLNLAGMEIHSNDMVAAGGLKHIGHELCCDWRARLILLVLAGIGEVWNDRSNTACRCSFASINHDQQFHQSIVDLARRRRLQDEDCTQDELQSICMGCKTAHTIFISNRLANGNRGFLVRVLKNEDLGELYSQPADGVSLDPRRSNMLCRPSAHPKCSATAG
jgi:hypothetical protein